MLKIIADYLTVVILLFLGLISKRLSIKGRIKFAKLLSELMIFLSPKRKKITLTNLKTAFPEKSDDFYHKVMRDSYHNLAIVLLELLCFKYYTENDFRKHIKYENIEFFEPIYARNKGLIVLSGHFGNWEMLAYSFGLFTHYPVLVIVKPQKNKIADNFLNQYRTKGGNSIVSMYNSAFAIVKQIREKKVVALLADQSATEDKDLYIDFFGVPASTYRAPAELALKFDVPIVMGFSIRQHDGTYLVKLHEIEHNDLQYNEEGVIELTRRHVKLLEDYIRKYPGHWAWQHKRWKHTKGFYEKTFD